MQPASTPELALERWPSPRQSPGPTLLQTTPQLALQRCCSTPLARTTQPLEPTRSSLTTAADSTMLSVPLRSLITTMDSPTTLLASPRFFETSTPIITLLLVYSRSGIMTQAETAAQTKTRQLALRRSRLT